MAAVIGFALVCYTVPSQAQVVSYKLTRTLGNGSKSVLKIRANIGRDLFLGTLGTTTSAWLVSWWNAKSKSTDTHPSGNQEDPLF
jgi:hypothetical protein